MNRNDFQQIATLRLREAKVLLDNHCYDSAYYLAGYAIECALKTCIAKQTQRYDFPDRKFVSDIYTHDLNRLMNLAGLEADYRIRKADSVFERNWMIVKDWSEQARYEHGVSAAIANDYYSAVTSRRNGIMPWIRKWW